MRGPETATNPLPFGREHAAYGLLSPLDLSKVRVVVSFYWRFVLKIVLVGSFELAVLCFFKQGKSN